MGSHVSKSLDSFNCRRTLNVGSAEYVYYDLIEAAKNGLSGISQLPYSMKVLLENLLRNEDGRSVTKESIAAVAGWAIGGGHVLHVVCDLTIAAENARFGQTGPKVGSFDGGFGASYLARIVGQKKAREIWYLCDQYDAQEALNMGLVNKVVPLDKLEETYVEWARKIIAKSPLAIRMLKASFNAELDGQAGIQELAGNATLLYYLSDEAKEGKNAFMEKREPDWSKFPKFP